MLSEKIVKALNEQVKREAEASFLYLSMGGWCDSKSLSGCANFLFEHSKEENSHMLKIYHYILEMNGKAIVPKVSAPNVKYDSIRTLFEQIYEHEKYISKSINNIVSLAIGENDHATNNFLQWYIEEQREEESLMRSILDKINLIGDSPSQLYHIDMEVAKMTTTVVPSE